MLNADIMLSPVLALLPLEPRRESQSTGAGGQLICYTLGFHHLQSCQWEFNRLLGSFAYMVMNWRVMKKKSKKLRLRIRTNIAKSYISHVR